MATIVKSITANPVKNGAAIIKTAATIHDDDGFDNLTNNDANIQTPTLAAIQNMADTRIDDERYYHGDTAD